MKKVILVVLMVVMVSTPCFAQEIKPNGLFTLNNTVWAFEEEEPSITRLGFADGQVYRCSTNRQQCDDSFFRSAYYNLFLLNIFTAVNATSFIGRWLGVLIPILEIGWVGVCQEGDPCIFFKMKKLPDFFDPDVYNPSL